MEQNPPASEPADDSRADNPRPAPNASASDQRLAPETVLAMQTQVMGQYLDDLVSEQRRTRRWKIALRLISLAFVAGFFVFYSLLLVYGPGIFRGERSVDDVAHIAVVRLEGQIAADGQASADNIIAGLRSAWEAEMAKAVVLRINSPGGSPVQSQRIYREIRRLASESETPKPVIAVIEDIGASGAYYAAAAADTILVSPSSLVGSIGVIQSGFGLKEAMQSLGVERRVFTAGTNKSFLDPFGDISAEQTAFWQGVLNTVHEQFIADVKAGRGDRLAGDDHVFSGLVWSGEQAVELGLADAYGDVSQVSREYLDAHRMVDYTPRPAILERLTRQLGVMAMELFDLPRSESGISLLP